MSIVEPSTQPVRFVGSLTKPMPGFTWMARLDCGPQRLRLVLIWLLGSARQTLGRPMHISGSTCHTIVGWSFAGMRQICGQH